LNVKRSADDHRAPLARLASRGCSFRRQHAFMGRSRWALQKDLETSSASGYRASQIKIVAFRRSARASVEFSEVRRHPDRPWYYRPPRRDRLRTKAAGGQLPQPFVRSAGPDPYKQRAFRNQRVNVLTRKKKARAEPGAKKRP